jgi:D-glycero-D-manno-heptose 1,7-bisphosphate phosphatase
MVIEAAQDYDIDLKKSFFVGDMDSDVECGKNAGVNTILLKNTLTDKEIISLQKEGKCPNFVAADFDEVYEYIFSVSTGGI